MFYVRFVGTRTVTPIEAENMKSAKWIFAIRHGLSSIGRIVASRKP